MTVWLSGYICLISIGCDLVADGLSPTLCNNLYLIFGPPLAETQLGYGGYGGLEVSTCANHQSLLGNFLMPHVTLCKVDVIYARLFVFVFFT